MFTLLGVPRSLGLTKTLTCLLGLISSPNGRYYLFYLFYLFYVYHIMSMFTLGRISQIYGRDRVSKVELKAVKPTTLMRLFSRFGYCLFIYLSIYLLCIIYYYYLLSRVTGECWVQECHRLAFSINEVSIYY